MTLFEIFKVTIYMPFDPKNTKSVFFCLHFAFFCLHFTIFYERRTNNIFQCFIVGNVYTEFIRFTAIKTVLTLSSLVDKKIITAILKLAELYTASCNPTKGLKELNLKYLSVFLRTT
jgi:hypothetical protein